MESLIYTALSSIDSNTILYIFAALAGAYLGECVRNKKHPGPYKIPVLEVSFATILSVAITYFLSTLILKFYGPTALPLLALVLGVLSVPGINKLVCFTGIGDFLSYLIPYVRLSKELIGGESGEKQQGKDSVINVTVVVKPDGTEESVEVRKCNEKEGE